MDAFVTIRRQKKSANLSLHEREIDEIKTLLENGTNIFLCGASGVGKTFILNKVFDETNSIELYDEVLTKKEIYLSTIRNSNRYTYIDDYESDTIYKSIIETVCEGGHVTKKPILVTSKNVHILPNFKMVFIPKRKPDIIQKLEPNHPRSKIASEKCDGNIQNFINYLDFKDEKDIFKTPKEIIEDFFCKPGTIDIEETIHEHGHIWGSVHENYLYSDTQHYDKIMSNLVNADEYDTELYKGEWDFMPYFVLHAMKLPKMYMKNVLDKEKIRPGSCWTKYGNQKMREQKVRNIQARSNTKMSHHEFMILREYAKQGDVSKFKEYSLTSQDFDVMNHLGIQNKLKQREVSKIKKMIKENSTK
jgi:Cdc6-like AAA superfamily ATPase